MPNRREDNQLDLGELSEMFGRAVLALTGADVLQERVDVAKDVATYYANPGKKELDEPGQAGLLAAEMGTGLVGGLPVAGILRKAAKVDWAEGVKYLFGKRVAEGFPKQPFVTDDLVKKGWRSLEELPQAILDGVDRIVPFFKGKTNKLGSFGVSDKYGKVARIAVDIPEETMIDTFGHEIAGHARVRAKYKDIPDLAKIHKESNLMYTLSAAKSDPMKKKLLYRNNPEESIARARGSAFVLARKRGKKITTEDIDRDLIMMSDLWRQTENILQSEKATGYHNYDKVFRAIARNTILK